MARQEILSGATGININRSHFSNVGRDQYNYYVTHQFIVQDGGKRRKIHKDLPELSEFTEVKRGDIYKDKNVCYSWRLCSNGKDDTEAAVYTAQIMISGRFADSKFTVKTYHGRNGKKEWRRDFLSCSKDWHGDVPLFGYNTSSIPSLIFYGELVPIAHIEARVGLMGQMYFDILKTALRCSTNELWMDPTKGTFCRGPSGPKCLEWIDNFDRFEIPPDVEFLKEDVVIRYLSSIKHDRAFLYALIYSSRYELLKERPSICYPRVISSMTNSTLAFNRNVRWWTPKGSLHLDGTMADGLTRFRLLADNGRRIEFDEDLSNIKLLSTYFELKGTLQKSKFKCQLRRLKDPIFLFVLPSPSTDTRFYFWSHDSSGKDRFSPDMCNHFGLPDALFITWTYHRGSWPTKIYKALHDYQVARGFDPTTADFAQSRCHPVFETTSPVSRFQEVDNEEAENTPNSYENNEDGGMGFAPTELEQMATGGSPLDPLHDSDDDLLEEHHDDVYYSLTTLFNRSCVKEFTRVAGSSSYLQNSVSIGYPSSICQGLEIPRVYLPFGQLSRRVEFEDSSRALSADLETLLDVD